MILIFKNRSATIKKNVRNLIKGYLTFRGGNIMYLKVENIKKYYGQGENKIEVLRGIDCGSLRRFLLHWLLLMRYYFQSNQQHLQLSLQSLFHIYQKLKRLSNFFQFIV